MRPFSVSYLASVDNFLIKTMGDLIDDHDDDRKNFIIGRYQNFESDLVDKLSSAGTFESFCDAVTIWINKPHVVNRRLCGSKIVYQNSTTDTNIDDFLKECLSCSEKYNSDAIHGSCVEEVPSLSSSIGATFYFVIREIFHKQYSQLSTKEAIIMGMCIYSYCFRLNYKKNLNIFAYIWNIFSDFFNVGKQFNRTKIM